MPGRASSRIAHWIPPRTQQWVRQQLAFLLIVGAAAATFVFLAVEPRHPVRGTGALAVIILLAALLRLVLPTASVGMLAVRSRWVDTLCYLLAGGLILVTDLRLQH